MRIVDTMDTAIARLLCVHPYELKQQTAGDTQDTHPAEHIVTFSIFFSGARCIVQYLLLPVLLPLLGIFGAVSFGMMVLIDLVALTAIVFSLRRFWKVNHSHKWDYFMFSLSIFAIILLFLWLDLQLLL